VAYSELLSYELLDPIARASSWKNSNGSYEFLASPENALTLRSPGLQDKALKSRVLLFRMIGITRAFDRHFDRTGQVGMTEVLRKA